MKLHPNAKLTPTQRRLIVDRVTRLGWPVSEAAGAVGVSARTVYKWLERYRQEGVRGLEDRRCVPRRSPTRTPTRLVHRIERLRRRRWTTWRIAEALSMPASTVSVILRRRGLGKLSALDPKPKVHRYERERAGELLHIDIKKLGRFAKAGHRSHGDRTQRNYRVGWEFAHVCVDDASRFAYVEILPSERKEHVVPFLQRAVKRFRRRGMNVKGVMTDNGSAYRSDVHKQACEQLGIRHLKTRPYTPRTNGKAERFIQTLQREWAYGRSYRSSKARTQALPAWLRYYNNQRPHCGIGRNTPAARLREVR